MATVALKGEESNTAAGSVGRLSLQTVPAAAYILQLRLDTGRLVVRKLLIG